MTLTNETPETKLARLEEKFDGLTKIVQERFDAIMTKLSEHSTYNKEVDDRLQKAEKVIQWHGFLFWLIGILAGGSWAIILVFLNRAVSKIIP
jgi:hypothetical protein